MPVLSDYVGIAMVAAPGVPGGAIMAGLGIITDLSPVFMRLRKD
ncbi:MAG: hypothetical protein V8S95_13390 [Odoribacter sp.]